MQEGFHRIEYRRLQLNRCVGCYSCLIQIVAIDTPAMTDEREGGQDPTRIVNPTNNQKASNGSHRRRDSQSSMLPLRVGKMEQPNYQRQQMNRCVGSYNCLIRYVAIETLDLCVVRVNGWDSAQDIRECVTKKERILK